VSHLVWLAATLTLVAGVAVAVSRPAVTAAAPRLGAVVEVLTLAAIGLAPPLLACTAAAVGTWSGAGGAMVAGVCVLAAGPTGPAQLALYGLAAAVLARTGVFAVRAVSVTRTAGLRGPARDGATPRRLPGGVTAWVAPSGQVAAWCGGLRRPQVVVTTGLLGLLEPAEQRAVLVHEAAHVRLGHPPILLFGAVIGRSYRWLPPATAAACQLLHAGPAWPGLIGCLAAFGYLGWRAAWARGPALAGRARQPGDPAGLGSRRRA